MKIAILGTRGVPNYHGGFEQFAEFVSVGMVKAGHEVWVYNSHNHPYQEKVFNGVHIIHCKDPENKIGTAGQFIYDFNCILDSRKRNFDVILQLGYTSSSVWSWLFPSTSKIITNMDGLEWKRSKYSKKVQKFLKMAESWGAKYSDHLIADSIGIQNYLLDTYSIKSTYIPYGAEVFNAPCKDVLSEFNLEEYNYDMLIARMEPENNIEIILDGITSSSNAEKILVIGKTSNKFGGYLQQKYENNTNICFLGGIYDFEKLNNLRYFSRLYFHGHSVGGTNPSLLEAMASNALICAHDNIFNRAILEDDAFYFSSSKDVSSLLDECFKKKEFIKKCKSNITKIETTYKWETITKQYLETCESVFSV